MCPHIGSDAQAKLGERGKEFWQIVDNRHTSARKKGTALRGKLGTNGIGEKLPCRSDDVEKKTKKTGRRGGGT